VDDGKSQVRVLTHATASVTSEVDRGQFRAVHDISGDSISAGPGRRYGYGTDRIAIAARRQEGISPRSSALRTTAFSKGRWGRSGSVSTVHAILDYYGASNHTTIRRNRRRSAIGVRQPALDRLLGPEPGRDKALAELASPVFHVDRGDPPLLLFHGDQDPQMPINQAHELQGAYEMLGLDVAFDVVHGAAHGGNVFLSGAHLERALAFLGRTISN
jgi:hypothetical protein